MSTNDGVRPFDYDCSPVRRTSAARCFTCASSSFPCLSLSLSRCTPHKTAAFDPLTSISSLCGRQVSKDPAVRIGSWIDANAVRHPVYVGCTKTEYKAEHLLIQTNSKHMQHVLPRPHVLSHLTALLLLRRPLKKKQTLFFQSTIRYPPSSRHQSSHPTNRPPIPSTRLTKTPDHPNIPPFSRLVSAKPSHFHMFLSSPKILNERHIRLPTHKHAPPPLKKNLPVPTRESLGRYPKAVLVVLAYYMKLGGVSVTLTHGEIWRARVRSNGSGAKFRVPDTGPETSVLPVRKP
ncbi:hypothetical protein V8C43DRAFT_179063 [Trichoderma afarasin]